MSVCVSYLDASCEIHSGRGSEDARVELETKGSAVTGDK